MRNFEGMEGTSRTPPYLKKLHSCLPLTQFSSSGEPPNVTSQTRRIRGSSGQDPNHAKTPKKPAERKICKTWRIIRVSSPATVILWPLFPRISPLTPMTARGRTRHCLSLAKMGKLLTGVSSMCRLTDRETSGDLTKWPLEIRQSMVQDGLTTSWCQGMC